MTLNDNPLTADSGALIQTTTTTGKLRYRWDELGSMIDFFLVPVTRCVIVNGHV